MMTTAQVLDLVDAWETAGIPVWVDGGWGVDALLEEQTREHQDLDIVLRCADRAKFDDLMDGLGFALFRDDGPANWVLTDPEGRMVDVHLADMEATLIDPRGIVVYGEKGLPYEMGSLEGMGRIGGREVRCCGARFQFEWHFADFAMTEAQRRDAELLAERFGFEWPGIEGKGRECDG
jgi:lincosamide nucleotidyltransferase A/C/D/E